MASITKTADSKYRAFIRKKGLSKSKLFKTKREAVVWANETEAQYEKHGKQLSSQPFSTAIKKYRDTVTPTKKGAKQETLRLNNLLSDPIAYIAIDELRPEHFENWRDRRLEDVSAGSVLREWNIVSNICQYCVRVWGVLLTSPISNAKRPQQPKPRDRLPTEAELQSIYEALNYTSYYTPETKIQIVGACLVFACETAMRAGEIVGLTWDNVFEKTVYIPETKTDEARTVPLSTNARKLLNSMKGVHHNKVFPISSSSLDSLYRKYRKKTGVVGLRFHDMRHYALTRMASKVDTLTLAKISGHRDLKILLNVYYNPDIADIADQLD